MISQDPSKPRCYSRGAGDIPGPLQAEKLLRGSGRYPRTPQSNPRKPKDKRKLRELRHELRGTGLGVESSTWKQTSKIRPLRFLVSVLETD